MAWIVILATVAGPGPRDPESIRTDRDPSVLSIVRHSDHGSSSIPDGLTVIDDRDVEADFDEPWVPTSTGLAADPFDRLAWSISGAAVNRRHLEPPESRPSRPFPLRC